MVWQAGFVTVWQGPLRFGEVRQGRAGKVSSGYARLVVSGFRKVRFGRHSSVRQACSGLAGFFVVGQAWQCKGREVR